jgi:hypothetical protein
MEKSSSHDVRNGPLRVLVTLSFFYPVEYKSPLNPEIAKLKLNLIGDAVDHKKGLQMIDHMSVVKRGCIFEGKVCNRMPTPAYYCSRRVSHCGRAIILRQVSTTI